MSSLVPLQLPTPQPLPLPTTTPTLPTSQRIHEGPPTGSAKWSLKERRSDHRYMLLHAKRRLAGAQRQLETFDHQGKQRYSKNPIVGGDTHINRKRDRLVQEVTAAAENATRIRAGLVELHAEWRRHGIATNVAAAWKILWAVHTSRAVIEVAPPAPGHERLEATSRYLLVCIKEWEQILDPAATLSCWRNPRTTSRSSLPTLTERAANEAMAKWDAKADECTQFLTDIGRLWLATRLVLDHTVEQLNQRCQQLRFTKIPPADSIMPFSAVPPAVLKVLDANERSREGRLHAGQPSSRSVASLVRRNPRKRPPPNVVVPAQSATRRAKTTGPQPVASSITDWSMDLLSLPTPSSSPSFDLLSPTFSMLSSSWSSDLLSPTFSLPPSSSSPELLLSPTWMTPPMVGMPPSRSFLSPVEPSFTHHLLPIAPPPPPPPPPMDHSAPSDLSALWSCTFDELHALFDTAPAAALATPPATPVMPLHHIPQAPAPAAAPPVLGLDDLGVFAALMGGI
ncbi:hypothetical protein BC828DRAFT_124636 [Blastocladiella britannica]|nr:hypothetical protein BC828DRAFT_124636 [Blastocladiella britannica]